MLLAKLDILIQGGEIMDKKLVSFFIVLLIITSTVVAQANNIKVNHEKMNYALIISVAPSINKALTETYKNSSKGVPQWGGSATEILEIVELINVRGSYDVTVKVYPYYGISIKKGEEEIKIRVESSGQKVISNKHIQDI